MITLRDKETGAILGKVSDDEFLFLAARLEQESPGDRDYFITRDLLESLAEQGMPATLRALLKAALGDRQEMDIEWARDVENDEAVASLIDRISRLTDDELLKMVLFEPDQYRPDALTIAREEIAKRALSMEKPAEPSDGVADTLSENELLGSLRQGVQTALSPSSYHAAGIEVACPHCKNTRFYTHNVLLNTRGLTFFRLDWLNRGATVLICSNCGMLQWFSETPE